MSHPSATTLRQIKPNWLLFKVKFEMVLLSVRIVALRKEEHGTVQNPMTEYLNLKEAAELLKRKPSTLYHYVRLKDHITSHLEAISIFASELLDLMGMNQTLALKRSGPSGHGRDHQRGK